MRGLLWFLAGAVFAPAFLYGAFMAREAFQNGFWKPNDVLRSAEIWSPGTGKWAHAADLLEPLAGNEAVALRGGEVLAVETTHQDLRAQLWSGGTWSAAGTLPYHSRFRLLPLSDGGALLAGTRFPEGDDLQLYQPARNAWRALPGPGYGTIIGIAELPQGVLAVTSDPLAKLRTRAGLLDPATGTWTEVEPPPETDYCTLTALGDGRALLAFERRAGDFADTPLAIFEGRRFTLLREKLASNLAGLPSWAVRLEDGRVLHLLENASRAILWNPRTGEVMTSPSPVPAQRPAVVPLGGGRLLATGGWIASGDEHRDLWDPDATAAAAIWDLKSGAATPLAPMSQARELHSAVALPDGRVLVFGGRGPAGHLERDNLRGFLLCGMLALASLAAASYAFVRSRRRVRALLWFLAGGAISLTLLAVFVLSKIRWPG